MDKRALILGLSFLTLLMLPACAAKGASRTVYAMDTVMTLTIYEDSKAEESLSLAEQTIHTLDALLSRTNESSEIYALNHGETVALSEQTRALLEKALLISQCTNGAFDPTIAPIMDAWGFGGSSYRVPSQEELHQLMQYLGTAQALSALHNSPLTLATAPYVTETEQGVSLASGFELDLGGIAKGFAADELRSLLTQRGVTHATIDLGGDICTIGAKPDGSLWRIAIKDPADSANFLGILCTKDNFIVTSGIYERFFEEDGVFYHHIIDPATGYPADSGLISVTAVCPLSGTWADALSTACFILGVDDSLALREHLADTVPLELIFLTDDGRVLYTDGLTETFDYSSTKGTYSYEVLS